MLTVALTSCKGTDMKGDADISEIANIKIGDYIFLGKYYDEPILWRCVDIDENGPLMFSDKIICIKPFDSKGLHKNDYNNYRQNYGSNLWETSNIRCWLNSTSAEKGVEWICGYPPTNDSVRDSYNDYFNEKGFLSNDNFSEKERNIIKLVSQKSILNFNDKDMAMGGNEEHILSQNITEVLQNYDNSYYKNISDKIFLIDVKQYFRIFKNSNILGEGYYVGRPTKKAVDKSELKARDLQESLDYHYWLRTPCAEEDAPNVVRYINYGGSILPKGYVDGSKAYDKNVGVRPAFYIDLSSLEFSSGNGSLNNPYRCQ
jgi:hypothetical protein